MEKTLKIMIYITVIFFMTFIAIYKINTVKNISIKEYSKKNEELNQKIKVKKQELSKLASEEEIKTNIKIVEDNKKLHNNYELLNTQLQNLEDTKSKLTKEYQNLSEEESKHIINNVPTINQYKIGYPTGCESTALTILLKYYNIDVTTKQIVEKLKKGRKPYYEKGRRYGGNPYIEFIGNPADAYSYGVYNDPIAKVAEIFKPGVVNKQNLNFDEVLNLVSNDIPVIVWNSMYTRPVFYSDSWIYKPTKEKIRWLSNLHAIVVIGYTKNYVITSDSLVGKIKYYKRNQFEKIYNAYGKRAIYYEEKI